MIRSIVEGFLELCAITLFCIVLLFCAALYIGVVEL